MQKSGLNLKRGRYWHACGSGGREHECVPVRFLGACRRGHCDVYYDPRTAVPGPPWVSLHAKCVVVDERWSFVSSANFTDRGHTRNIELGVLIEDAAFAEQIVTHWRALVAAGRVVPGSQPMADAM